MMLRGTDYEETSFVLPRLRDGTADARSRSGQSRRREGAVRGRSRGLPGQGGSRNRGVVSAGRTRQVHRHDAHAFVYVLEGQIVMQLKGQPAVTLKAGQTFYEGPADVHVVGRNASATEPARFVVVLLKARGAPILTPVKE